VTGAERMELIRNVPTMREEGVPGYELTAWYATFFPAKTPPQIVATMRDALRKASQTKTVVEALKVSALEPLNLEGEELTTLNRKELDKWTKVIRDAGIKLN
jgi:tripartite-type tricarboxylate transporter receptor subunit TctC